MAAALDVNVEHAPGLTWPGIEVRRQCECKYEESGAAFKFATNQGGTYIQRYKQGKCDFDSIWVLKQCYRPQTFCMFKPM